MRILLVEDDETLVEVLTTVLVSQNYVVDVAVDGEIGWEMVISCAYDLVLLDVGLPKMNGITFCRKLRDQDNQVLVMLLTARDCKTDKLVGLDAGADDYVVKPFDVEELTARIRALLRRGKAPLSTVLEWGQFRLDLQSREATYRGKPLRFSRKEYLLLELFLRNPRRIYNRSAIIDQLWSFDEEPPNEDTVKSHIKSVRRKLRTAGAGDLIETLYGQGYRLNLAYADEGVLGELDQNSVLPETDIQSNATASGTTHLPAPVLEEGADESEEGEKLRSAVAQIWQRTRQSTLDRIAVLQQLIYLLKADRVDDDLYLQASQVAHKLTGSLGTFGLEEGSRIARQLETLFQSKRAPQYVAQQAQELLDDLNQLLVAENSETAAVQPPTSAPNQGSSPQGALLVVGTSETLKQQLMREGMAQKWRVELVGSLEDARHSLRQACPSALLIGPDLNASLQPLEAFFQEVDHQYRALPILLLSDQAVLRDRIHTFPKKCTFLPPTADPARIFQAATQLLQPVHASEANVLAVDDDPQILAAVEAALTTGGMTVRTLNEPNKFWETLQSTRPDLLVLDISMPQTNGLEICRSLRQDWEWSWLPVVFLTAHTDPDTLKLAFQAGADDYLPKPVVPMDLLLRVRNRLQRSTLLRQQSEIDVLTGLTNRQSATRSLNQLIKLASRAQAPVCVAALGLDGFKYVNEKYGLVQGDMLLRQFGQFLRRSCRAEDVVARWGKDEFVIGMYGASRQDGVERMAAILESWRVQSITTPEGAPLHVHFSGGVAQYPIDGTDAQMVYRSADGALLQAKLGGRDRIVPTGWSSSSATPNGVDVALIYPDDTFANAIEEALKTRGYRVQWFTQGREGLRHLSGDPDPLVPRVLLLGEQLPDMTGLECLTQLTASGIGSALPILLVRNLDSFRDLPLGQPYDCLKIPCTISALLQRIHRQLALSANH